MPLSPPAEREPLHHRTIDLKGYRRQDGLYDIEGHLVDTKSYGFDNSEKGRVEAGEHLHEMWLRLTIDESFTLRDVEAATDASPFRVCGEVPPNFKTLIGLKIGPGWRREALKRVGGAKGCTHLVEMLWPLATVAFQTLAGKAEKRTESWKAEGGRPRMLDSCHAFRADGEKARTRWPDFYTGPAVQGGAVKNGD